MPLGFSRLNFLAKTQEAAALDRESITFTAYGNAQVSTAQAQFGGASAVFDGTTDVITMDTVNDSVTNFDGSGDFTIECWVRPNNIDATGKAIFDWRGVDASYGGNGYATTLSGNVILVDCDSFGIFRVYIDGSNRSTGGTNTFAANTWHHVAVQRESGVINAWLNGTRYVNYTTSTDFTSLLENPQPIGMTGNGTNSFNGYIDEFRISSIARYTNGATITVPTSAFTNDSDTVALLHCDGTNGSTEFLDDIGGGAPAVPQGDWSSYDGTSDGSIAYFVDNSTQHTEASFEMFDDTYGVVFYHDDTDIYYRTITVSGTGITYGTATDTGINVDNADRFNVVRLSDTLIVCHAPYDASPGYVAVASNSSGTISMTTSNLTGDGAVAPNSRPMLAAIDSTDYLMAGRRADATGNSYLCRFSVDSSTKAVTTVTTTKQNFTDHDTFCYPVVHNDGTLLLLGRKASDTTKFAVRSYTIGATTFTATGTLTDVKTYDTVISRTPAIITNGDGMFFVDYDGPANSTPPALTLGITPIKWTGSSFTIGTEHTVSGGGSPLVGWTENMTHHGSEKLRDVPRVEFIQPNQDGTNENQILVYAIARESSNMNQIQASVFALDYDNSTVTLSDENADYPLAFSISHGDAFGQFQCFRRVPGDGSKAIAVTWGQEGIDRTGPKTYKLGLKVLSTATA